MVGAYNCGLLEDLYTGPQNSNGFNNNSFGLFECISLWEAIERKQLGMLQQIANTLKFLVCNYSFHPFLFEYQLFEFLTDVTNFNQNAAILSFAMSKSFNFVSIVEF